MRRTGVCSILIAAALSVTPAWPQTLKPLAGTDKVTLASEQDSQSWAVPLPAQTGHLHTALLVSKLGYNPYKTPSFAITLSGGNNKVILNAVSPDFRKPLQVRLELWVGKTFLRQLPYDEKLALDSPMDIRISWMPSGEVHVTAGSQTQTVNLNAKVSSVSLSATVGEATFFPLETGKYIKHDFFYGYHMN